MLQWRRLRLTFGDLVKAEQIGLPCVFQLPQASRLVPGPMQAILHKLGSALLARAFGWSTDPKHLVGLKTELPPRPLET
jgi:hypothetical protein